VSPSIGSDACLFCRGHHSTREALRLQLLLHEPEVRPCDRFHLVVETSASEAFQSARIFDSRSASSRTGPWAPCCREDRSGVGGCEYAYMPAVN